MTNIAKQRDNSAQHGINTQASEIANTRSISIYIYIYKTEKFVISIIIFFFDIKIQNIPLP